MSRTVGQKSRRTEGRELQPSSQRPRRDAECTAEILLISSTSNGCIPGAASHLLSQPFKHGLSSGSGQLEDDFEVEVGEHHADGITEQLPHGAPEAAVDDALFSFPSTEAIAGGFSPRRVPGSKINLSSASLSRLRSENSCYVDKTAAIANFLSDDSYSSRAVFTRPRKFGKSLLLDTVAKMLAVGPLPSAIPAWNDYDENNINVFEGLAVFEWLKRGPLLGMPCYVIHLGLGAISIKEDLDANIKTRLAWTAQRSFGIAAADRVLAAPGVAGALGELIALVPAAIPIALLIDEYDHPINDAVSAKMWDLAKDRSETLKTLMAFTKEPCGETRIKRCVVTGVAKFAHISLFSGANNFVDVTYDPILSSAIGFSEAEIVASFPDELLTLGRNISAKSEVTDDEYRKLALSHLKEWYNGYCFDGKTSCYNPYAVLCALRAGNITETELSAVTQTHWLNLAPLKVIEDLGLKLYEKARVDLADVVTLDVEALRRNEVDVLALMLQVGLLTLQPSSDPANCRELQCVVPNNYARQSLISGIAAHTTNDAQAKYKVKALIKDFQRAVVERDHCAFSACIAKMVEGAPYHITKKPAQETTFQGIVYAFLRAALPDCAHVEPEPSINSGRMDLRIDFDDNNTRWVLELGVGVSTFSKLAQMKKYVLSLEHPNRLCAAITFNPTGKASSSSTDPEYNCQFDWWTCDKADNNWRQWDPALNDWSDVLATESPPGDVAETVAAGRPIGSTVAAAKRRRKASRR